MDFFSRVLIAGVALAGWASSFVHADEWTERERALSVSAFPEVSLESPRSPLAGEVESQAKKILSDAADLVRLNPEEFFAQAVPGKTLTSAQVERVLRGVSGIQVQVCREKCKPCGERLHCLASLGVGNEVGATFFVRECALTQGCVSARSKTRTKVELRTAVEEALGVFANVKIAGISWGRERVAKNARAAAEVLRRTAASVNGILSRCPGPYRSEDSGFLSRLGHLARPSSVSQRCGEAYLKILSAREALCPKPAKTKEVLACDGYCQTMLCMGKSPAPQVRVFSGKRVLILRSDSCAGEKPTAIEGFEKFARADGCGL